MEHANASPVVDGLQGQVEVVVCFELEDGEATLTSDGEQIEQRAVGRCEGEELRVDRSIAEVGVDEREVAAENRFKPALGLEAEERVVGGGGGITAAEEAIHEVEEEVFGGFIEEGFARGRAEGDLVLTREGAVEERVADAGVFEAVEREGDFGRGTRTDFRGVEKTGWEQRAEVVNGDAAAIERGCGVECVRKLDG